MEQFLRGQDREVEELRAQLRTLKADLSAASKQRTVGEVQLAQIRENYTKNLEQLSTRVRCFCSMIFCHASAR